MIRLLLVVAAACGGPRPAPEPPSNRAAPEHIPDVCATAIQGVVVDATNDHLAGATIVAEGPDHTQAVAITDEHGHFVLEKLAKPLTKLTVYYAEMDAHVMVTCTPMTIRMMPAAH